MAAAPDAVSVDPVPIERALLRMMRRARRALAHERGFTLIEAVLAMAIFAAVATSLSGVLTSSISARSLASQRTAAEQIASDQIEWIRSLDYDTEVGCTTSSPTCPVKGVVDPTGSQTAQGGPAVPSGYSVTITIKWVDDAVPTAHRTYKNYKNVTVTVFRVTDSKQMAQQSTQVGPRQRALFGGINKGTVQVQVNDYLSPMAPHPGVVVNLNNGPSSPLTDTSDAAGSVIFPGLDPASGSTYYDLVVPTFGGGWIALPDPATTHFQLAAGSAPSPKALQVYKPVTLTFQPQNADGTPYSSAAVFTVTGPEGTDDFTYNPATGAPITVTSLTQGGVSVPLPPGPYTITPKSGMYADPVATNDPATIGNYPTDLTASVNIVSDAIGSISATVTSSGSPVVGATVTVAGGPRSLATLTATTNASGVATVPGLPVGAGYTVAAVKGGLSAPAQTVTVTAGPPATNVALNFPTGSLKAIVSWAGTLTSGATVTLTGGPGAVSLSGTSDVNGEVLFSNVAVGSGYTMTATKTGSSTAVSPTVVSGATTDVPIALPLSLVATVTWLGSNVSGATVTLSGGPSSLSPISAVTTGSGQITFSPVPAGSGYTLSATKNGITKTLTNQTVNNSSTPTAIGVVMPTGTITVNAATWAAQPAGSATITVSGGANTPTTYTGTTDASGVVSITVPATTSANPYTVTATKINGSGTASVTSLASGATATVSVTMGGTGTIAVNAATWAGQPAGTATVTITGGENTGATYTGTTNSSGVVNVVVPTTTSANPYTVTVAKAGGTGSASVTNLANGGTATVTPAITPTKTLTITVKRNGSNLVSAAVVVSITGGPNGVAGALPAYGGTFTTSASGVLSAITVPAGAGGYTVKVYLSNCALFATYRSGSLAAVSSTGSGTNTAVPINFSVSAAACPFSPLP